MSAIDQKRLDAWRGFLTAHAALITKLGKEMQDAVGLPLSWYEVLLILHESDDGHCRMHQVADARLLSRSAATRLVDRMERSGLVERRLTDDDGRGIVVQMTDEGRQQFLAAGRIHLAGIAEHFGHLVTAEEASTVGDVMWRLANDATS